jgi:peptidoglycan hydrolase-like protein with peptidoglycan-binding domain
MSTFYKIYDRSAANRSLQEKLRYLSRSDPQLPSVFIDGIYGSETESAVRIYQQTRGLPETGVVDYETHRKITDEYTLLLRQNERIAGSPDFDSYNGGTISYGDRFDGVLALQLLFRSIAEQDDRFSTDTDGVYGDTTASAVRLFKSLRGMEDNGKVDRLFWNELALFADRYSEQ